MTEFATINKLDIHIGLPGARFGTGNNGRPPVKGSRC